MRNSSNTTFGAVLSATLICLVLIPSVSIALAEDFKRTTVIISFEQGPFEHAITQLSERLGYFPVKYRYKSLPGVAACLTQRQIDVLSRIPFVRSIEFDTKTVHIMLDGATYWFGADAASLDFSVDGSLDGSPTYSAGDIVIAVVDTGIDATHIDLDEGKVIGWVDLVNMRLEPYDDNGHGTHVSSIATGTGEGNPSYRGVAPGAALVGVKVLDSSGTGYISDVNYGIQWVIDNKDVYGIEVMSLSLGISGSSDGTDSTSTLVNMAVANGIVAVVAAGNGGPRTYTIGSPAAAEQAITVGALADPSEKGFYLASFSSRGPTKDGRIKPDVCAPGVSITAAKANSGNGYVTYSGTSMATPFVSGTVALILCTDPTLDPAQVKNILASSALDFGLAGKDVEYGYGRLDTYRAVETARGIPGSGGPKTPAHRFMQDTLSGTGDIDNWSYDVVSVNYPIAVTLIMPDWKSAGDPDFDLYLYGPDSALVASSTGVSRQETIAVMVAKTGTYTVRVKSYIGSGNYFLDLSAGLESETVPEIKKMHVADIAMSVLTKATRSQAEAVVIVVDNKGSPVQGVTVTGTWSGLVKGTATATTDANGQAIFNSRWVNKAKGTFTFTVVDLAKAEWVYDPSANKVTSASITI
ncbi:MAG: S8 family serine peptidase [Candidatus Bathyarchaeia archaeon]